MDSENDIEKILRIFKPEGPEYRYRFCVVCDRVADGSMIMDQYGICTTCLKKLLMIPPRLYPYIGRILLFASRKELIVLGDVNL